MAAVILAGAALTGCGGSSASKASIQTVSGPTFRFQAPAGWKVTRTDGRVSAAQGSSLLQVASFRLSKPYTPALFGPVASELQLRMKAIAAQTGGTVGAGRTVTAGGIRSHAYQVTSSGHVDENTFVLAARREYQLLCRRTSSDGVGTCKELLTTFTIS